MAYSEGGIFVEIETSICHGSDSRLHQDKSRSTLDTMGIGISEVGMINR